MAQTRRVQAFLKDVSALCIKYGLSIEHEDTHGAFLVRECEYDGADDPVFGADDETGARCVLCDHEVSNHYGHVEGCRFGCQCPGFTEPTEEEYAQRAARHAAVLLDVTTKLASLAHDFPGEVVFAAADDVIILEGPNAARLAEMLASVERVG